MTEPEPVPGQSPAAGRIPTEPLKLRSEWAPFARRWDVILGPDGIAWRRDGSDASHWVPWPLLGGVSNGIVGEHTVSASPLALDGSSFGSIDGLLQLDGEPTSLSHAIALYRPDLFVEVDGFPWTGGCIRREVAASEETRLAAPRAGLHPTDRSVGSADKDPAPRRDSARERTR